ncbi:hypothetical protein LSH36_1031g00008 [Paralvinella palmiformis]|uniref:G-protein coupled receptors family 1 profile domain-containing protein n=1 Tax=Paralvinella palmiformis TaxID=53620 RepID=A0AAD9IVQ6_9ANNE|nr:hypothetical protein LSH36_1031g00008 [Paralvinella palmiformis]
MSFRDQRIRKGSNAIYPLFYTVVYTTQDTDISVFYNNMTYAVMVNCAEYNVRGPNDRTVFAYYQLLTMFILPVIVLLFCYTIVIQVLWRSNKELVRMTQTETNRKEANSCSRQHKGHVRLSNSPSPRAVKGHSVEVREARKQKSQTGTIILCALLVFARCEYCANFLGVS